MRTPKNAPTKQVKRTWEADSIQKTFALRDQDRKFTLRGKKVTIEEAQGATNNNWPKGHLDYAFLERCKEVICRIPHPNNWFKHKDRHYRVSVIPWSRGGYVDIRTYFGDKSSGRGVLLHLDVIKAMLPSIAEAVHRLETQYDTREPGEAQPVTVVTESLTQKDKAPWE